MMDLVNDPGSFVVGCSVGFFFGCMCKQALIKIREGVREYREGRELDRNGNGVNGHA